MSANADTPDEPAPSARTREVFSVHLSVSGKAKTFEDPREAGRAFFLADPAERPSVTHMVGNSARAMARTEIHRVHPDGEPRYFKSLPASHAPDAAFREGFLEVIEQSLKEKLGGVAAVERPAQAVRVDARLVDDLESFAYRAPARAAQLWAGYSADVPPGPVLKAAVDAYFTGLSHENARIWKDSCKTLCLSEKANASDRPTITRQSEEWER